MVQLCILPSFFSQSQEAPALRVEWDSHVAFSQCISCIIVTHLLSGGVTLSLQRTYLHIITYFLPLPPRMLCLCKIAFALFVWPLALCQRWRPFCSRRRALPRSATSGHGLACPALPCSSNALPRSGMPCFAMPCHALPRSGTPCHALPRCGTPCHRLACSGTPCHGPARSATSCHGLACPATPCHALPRPVCHPSSGGCSASHIYLFM